MRIFVGSSTSQVALTRDKSSIDIVETAKRPIGQLVSALRAKGLVVEPWWEPATFQKGRNLLECLLEKAKTCDGGIFVVRGDDRLAADDGTGEIAVPKGNVILECGMFLAAKGKDATFIIKHGTYSAIRWPTDILGTLIPDLSDRDIVDQAFRFFLRTKSWNGDTASEVYINDILMRSVFGRECAKWSTKGLYLGAESARRWTAIESGPNYLQRKELVQDFVNRVHRDSSIPINFEAIDNIISLGPGCGVVDHFLVSKVAEFKPNICYIPIDINPYLAQEAIRHMQSIPGVRTPFTIIDDFEEHHEHVDAVIKERIRDYRQVNVFTMLGGTFCNLEGDEHYIAHKFRTWMDENDYLIVDALIKDAGYLFEADTEVQVATMNPAYKMFLINACINKCVCAVGGDVSRPTQRVIASVANDLPGVLSAEEVRDEHERRRYTGLAGTVVTAYKTKQLNGAWATMRQEMLIAKRYDCATLEEFLRSHFKVLYVFSEIDPEKHKGRAMYLLMKKELRT